MANPRLGSYGYTLRVDTGIDLNAFVSGGGDITLRVSASSTGGFNLNYSASTLFIGQSTIYSSTEGVTFNSGQWVYGQNLTANAFATADDYSMWVAASATARNFISEVAIFTVDA